MESNRKHRSPLLFFFFFVFIKRKVLLMHTELFMRCTVKML